MAKNEHRLEVNGKLLDYTCKNYRFHTDIEDGYSHGSLSRIKGSALKEPLASHNGYTLWLEHVIDADHNKTYWFMWYLDGIPQIPASGVLSKEDLTKISKVLAQL